MLRYEIETTTVNGTTGRRFVLADSAEKAIEKLLSEWTSHGDAPPARAEVVASWGIQS